ncbi:hypothetical protein BcabD6B2_58850 (apicoplast) [Babesia caballi]|uniref:Uncharacterized protein n=1 Tax=Babesia caballi TaxID=5871 RepID=A0AAV4M244_BABCB|nr:hypothetical protein BcabD6B2_58850 [Babesia caballi]
MKFRFDKINRCYYNNNIKIQDIEYKIIISTIFFKFNNVFINVSKFHKYGNVFIFITILKSLSCGQFKNLTHRIIDYIKQKTIFIDYK